MTDLTTLTDDQICVKAAEAMGWKHCRSVQRGGTDDISDDRGQTYYYEVVGLSPNGVSGDVCPDPLHNLNDAVALAEKWRSSSNRTCPRWILQSGEPEHTKTGGCCWDNGELIVEHYADSPARALTMAVLGAMETTDESS